ncbi:hypothetical protein [Adlercreutzia caecimuris]|uniref:hypothetical protein n=1 Tax=Adlercreutzia caecimuris TaxID=671266 RepID=UPI00272ABEBF|nr:hypothetical protein [Adlercreutzia caecimuris]
MKKGDYVLFDTGFGDCDLGRVASVSGNIAFVCFSTGCTASACTQEYLRVIEPSECEESISFGHHRFDDFCPDYDPDCCSAYCPDKAGVE